MYKLIFVAIFAFQAFACSDPPTSTQPDSYCTGEGWLPYLDEKCFKLIKQFSTRDQASQLCASSKLPSDPSTPTLLTIKSSSEQTFFTNYIYQQSNVKNNVWLGAKRNESNLAQFIWDDGKVVEKFVNWVLDSPTGDFERNCVDMQSRTSRKVQRGVEGAWRDVNCELGNFVVCEKPPQWSMAKMQKLILEGRSELSETKIKPSQTQNELSQTRNELGETKEKLSTSQNELKELKNNPVPIGYIYVQLPKEPEPKTIWSQVEWQDVSSEYAGLFFRAQGGDAATFGSIQEGNAPRVIQVREIWRDDGGYAHQPIDLPIGSWSTDVGVIASWVAPGGRATLTHHFHTSGGEVRPKNMAMRIWKRVK